MTTETSAAIDIDTWRVLEALHNELRMPKKHLIRLAVKHLADCGEVKKGLASLGFDVAAIEKLIRTSKVYLSVPVS